VWALDRLSREGPLATLEIVHRLGQSGVQVWSYQEPWTEAGEKHQQAGGSYSEVKRKLDIFLLRHSATDESRLGTIVDELDTIGGRLSQLERESPDIPDPLYDQARRVFEEGPMVASWKTIKVALVL